MTHEDEALVALFAGLDTPAVSDALDRLALHGQCPGVAPLDSGGRTAPSGATS